MKKLTTLLTGFAMLTALAGCATESAPAETTAPVETTEATAETVETVEEESASASAEGYPMTISHALGEITLESKPEHIVAIAWGNPDVVLALGVEPAGISEANFGPRDENGLLPWTAKAYADNGWTPNVFNDTDGWDYEAIADANPDVILAAYSGLTQEDYDRLSEIAPVMAYPEKAWATTWRDEAVQDAKAMGMEEEGKALVESVDAMLKEKLAAYPELAGKKTAFVWLSEDDLGSFYIYTDQDPRANFLNDLGLVMPDSVKNMITGDDFYITVSAENADQLNDIDIIITYGASSLVEKMQADGRFANIPAVNNGAFVLLDSSEALSAASTPTVLSIPYCIDEYLEVLSEAASHIQE